MNSVLNSSLKTLGKSPQNKVVAFKSSSLLLSSLFKSVKCLSSASSDLLPALCREREGCGGEEGEAVTEEESQTGDQRRQDGEQSPGESSPAAFKPLLYEECGKKNLHLCVPHSSAFEMYISYLGTSKPLCIAPCCMLGRHHYFNGLTE